MICYKTLFILLSFTVVTHAAYNYYFEKKKKPKREIHDAIMFSYDAECLTTSKYSRCKVTKSMDRLLYYLNQPKYNLDVCMYVLTNVELTKTLIALNYRGIKIRIIADADMAYAPGSNIRKFSKCGIPVRWMKSTNLMHHKFCLIDTLSQNTDVTPLLMVGSLNWTNQALCGNNENCLITSQEQLIKKYQAEFDKLWDLFKPIVE
ncbi:uncharacterized protein LOC142984774 [Anticarsia gemmatalis]|uniref:uncharacterized protein LOC142984774 n=1 Tax=Anticarsia gemmatalis TaxID=129554 RepID=UPI003F759AFA